MPTRSPPPASAIAGTRFSRPTWSNPARWFRFAGSKWTGYCSATPKAPSACSKTGALTAVHRCLSGNTSATESHACTTGCRSTAAAPSSPFPECRAAHSKAAAPRCHSTSSRPPTRSSRSSRSPRTRSRPLSCSLIGSPILRCRGSRTTRSGRGPGAFIWTTSSIPCTALSCTAIRIRCSAATSRHASVSARPTGASSSRKPTSAV
jgi:hypothetical protein